MAIFALKATNSATPASWAQRIMTHAVIRIVNYVAIRGRFAVIKTRHVARIANLCRQVLSVANKSMPRVRERHVVREHMPSVPSHRPWMMVQYVKNVVNVVMANAVS